MFKMLITFVSLFIIFFMGIDIFRRMTNKEKWALTKLLTYSTICAVLTMLTLIFIVLVF